MKRLTAVFIGALLFLAAFSLLIYPSPYKYYEFTNASGTKFPIKENRFTGKIRIFNAYSGQWVEKLNKD